MRKWVFIFVFIIFITSCKEGEKHYELFSSSDQGIMVIDKNHTPIVEILDVNEDGILDFIRYSFFDVSGDTVIEIEDCGMDGNAEQRWHFPTSSESYIEISYLGKWYRLHTAKEEKGTPFIIFDNQELPVKRDINGCLRVSSIT